MLKCFDILLLTYHPQGRIRGNSFQKAYFHLTFQVFDIQIKKLPVTKLYLFVVITKVPFYIHFLQDAVACSVGISGCVIKEHKSEQQTPKVQQASSDETDPTDNISSPRSQVTHMTLLCQVNLQGSLQVMMKGAYRSGLLVYGMRSFFQNLTDHIDSYVKIVDF